MIWPDREPFGRLSECESPGLNKPLGPLVKIIGARVTDGAGSYIVRR
jgi:hypothetical protein